MGKRPLGAVVSGGLPAARLVNSTVSYGMQNGSSLAQVLIKMLIFNR